MYKYRKLACILIGLSLAGNANALIINMFSGTGYDTDTAAMDGAFGLTGLSIEDFEDTTLVSGLSIQYFSPDAGPVTSLSQTYTDGSGSFNNNSWDGSNALVNTFDNDIWFGGPNGDQRVKLVDLISFDVGGVDLFGIGLGNFQADVVDHNLLVNGVEILSALESLANFTTGINLRNGYLTIQAEAGESIETVGFGVQRNADGSMPTGFVRDGLIFDHLAFGNIQSEPPVNVVEPSIITLFAAGLVGLGLILRRGDISLLVHREHS